MRQRVIAGKYELEDLLGQGGMGSVWRARDRSLARPVAVKVMADRHLRSATSRERFGREARALASLRNPHVVQIHDYGVEDDAPYIVMELLSGESLETRLARTAPLSPGAFLPLFRQLCEGLSAATALNMVHRDLKPENVFIVSEGGEDRIKILDFGLASMRGEASTSESKIVGTPAYMSPEALRGNRPAAAHDLWSASVIAYRALSGRLPFHHRYLGKLIVSICTDPAPSPSSLVPALNTDIDGFFRRALAKDPSQRFGSAAKLLDGFVQALRASGAIKVLVVDDEPDMQQLIKLRFHKQIRARRYHFEFALNGVEALEQLRRHSDVDVILADINMPEMDGLTLLAKVPELAPHARTIMVSAYSNMSNIRQAMNSGAFDFVVKPIDFNDLEATIQRTAAVVATQRQLEARDQENGALRRLTSPGLLERITNLGPVALHTPEAIEGTIVEVRLPRASQPDALESPVGQLRRLNALFEVIVPELERSGGVALNFSSQGVAFYVTGFAHVQRALQLTRKTMHSLTKLAELAGPDTPYAEGIAIGIATGSLILACLGSHTCGRLSFTAIGAVRERARALASAAGPGEVLSTGHIATAEGHRTFFSPAPPSAHEAREQAVFSFSWRRGSSDEELPKRASPSSTLTSHALETAMGSVGSVESLEQAESLEEDLEKLGELLFGWTLSEA